MSLHAQMAEAKLRFMSVRGQRKRVFKNVNRIEIRMKDENYMDVTIFYGEGYPGTNKEELSNVKLVYKYPGTNAGDVYIHPQYILILPYSVDVIYYPEEGRVELIGSTSSE